jgi:hypothetical protein
VPIPPSLQFQRPKKREKLQGINAAEIITGSKETATHEATELGAIVQKIGNAKEIARHVQ